MLIKHDLHINPSKCQVAKVALCLHARMRGPKPPGMSEGKPLERVDAFKYIPKLELLESCCMDPQALARQLTIGLAVCHGPSQLSTSA